MFCLFQIFKIKVTIFFIIKKYIYGHGNTLGDKLNQMIWIYKLNYFPLQYNTMLNYKEIEGLSKIVEIWQDVKKKKKSF